MVRTFFSFIALGMALAAMFFLAFTLPTSAQQVPEEFDHPYPGELILHKVQGNLVTETCMAFSEMNFGIPYWSGKRLLLGCALKVSEGVCVVIIRDRDMRYPSGVRVSVLEIYRHERAHCNGWKHD